MSSVDNAEVWAFLVLGVASLFVAIVMDCWRPGRTHNAGGKPLQLNRHCCGVIMGRGLLIPLIFVLLLALLLLDFANQPDSCTTPLGYCATISCVCGNIIWQGYVFMFVALSLTPVLVIMGVVRGSTKFLCCLRGASCGQYDRLYQRDADILTAHDFFIVWPYLLGTAAVCVTGMMPYLIPGNVISQQVSGLTDALHNLGVLTGVIAPAVAALFLAIRRAFEATNTWTAEHFLFCRCGCSRSADDDDETEDDWLNDSKARNSRSVNTSNPGIDFQQGLLADQRAKPASCCAQLGECDHRAWAAIGYSAMAVIVGAAIVVMFEYLAVVSDAHNQYDLCINNDDEQSCLLGNHCEWNSTAS